MTDADRLTTALQSAAPSLLAYFRRRVDAEDAADLLAETMTTAWRRVSALPADAEQSRMWLFGVARNVLLNGQRGERRRFNLADKARALLAETAPPSDEGLEVRDAISRLPAEHAELVQLVHWEGLTIGQAAEVVGIPASTARSRYAKAKAELRLMLVTA